MTADVELLPCPFCGNDVRGDEGCFQSAGFRTPSTPVWSVRCGNPECNADVSAIGEAAAIAHWNTRAATAAQAAEIEALRAEVKLLTHKVITCGVAADHPDKNLTRTGAYASDWNSQQAERVRALRARAERLAEALREVREYVTDALQAQRKAFAGHEHCSDIPGIEADLHKIDALLRDQEEGRD